MLRVAIQGEPGSFSQEAAVKLLGPKLHLLACPTFDVAFSTLRRGRADRCLVPIENTLAGSVHENYDLLLEHKFWVEAELNLRIRHMLIALKGATLREIREAHSHTVALAQCRKFFARHPRIRPVAAYDTAGSVRMIMKRGDPRAAAVASRAAAATYGAKIVARGIEDDPGNFTRFLLLNRTPHTRPGANKTSIVFGTRNIPGSLFRCLAAFSLRDINLTKIESRPWRGKPWEYLFYLDFAGQPDRAPARQALSQLQEIAPFVRVLGCYRADHRR